MPTYANQVAAGEGVFRARLVIEGWPTIYCDSKSLVGNLADGRQQLQGLDPLTLRLAAQADLLRADLVEQEAAIEVVDDKDHAISASFTTRPSARTWLTADLGVSATTATVANTDGFASSGVIHINTEAIQYSGKTSTTFTGLTRGSWNTKAQAHYTGDGESLSYPVVTNRPRSMRGRRCSIYLFGSSDSVAGGGTERWRGVIRSDAEYQQGRWTFAVEPRSWILDQPIGADLEEPTPIRGIYLPASAAFSLRLWRRSGSSRADAYTAEEVSPRMSGWFPDNASFCEAVTTQIATAVSSWTWDADAVIRLESQGATGYRFVYRVGSSNAHWVDLNGFGGRVSPVDHLPEVSPSWVDATTGLPTEDLSAGRSYYIEVAAPVPRAVVGQLDSGDWLSGSTWFVDYTRPDNTPDKVFLGGTTVPASYQFVTIDSGREGDEPYHTPASAADTSDRYVTVGPMPAHLLGPNSRIHIMRALATATGLGGLLNALIANSPTLVNSGGMPLITTDDLDTSDFSAITEAESSARLAYRYWFTGDGVSLREILVHELRLRGLYIAPNSTGQLTIKRLRPPLKTDSVAATLDSNTVGPGFPAMSLSPYGHIKTVVIRQHWDVWEQEHGFPSLRVRNVASDDPLGGVLEIAPRSRSSRSGPESPEVSVEDAYLLASGVLGMFGVPYQIVTLPDVSIEHMDAAQIGNAVTITSNFLPDTDGSWGLTAKPGMLIGYDWSPYEGRGAMTVLLLELDTGGYSPGFVVSNAAGSGTSWTFTLTLSPHTDETNVSTWLAVGDEVRIIERDSASPTRQSGTITGVTDPNFVDVEFDSTFTEPSEYFISYDTTSAVDESAPSGRIWAQTDFLQIADATRRIARASGDVDAMEFAP